MKTAECGIHTSTSGSDTRGRSGPSSFGSLGQVRVRLQERLNLFEPFRRNFELISRADMSYHVLPCHAACC